MKNPSLSNALETAYRVLGPFSARFQVDRRRYLHTLDIITSQGDWQGKNILDIGTGIGLTPLALKQLGIACHGLDYYVFPENDNTMFGIDEINELETIWAKEELTIHNLDFLNCSPSDLPQKFDIIIAEAIIEHLPDPRLFLERCATLLNKEGLLLISTPNLATLLKRLRFVIGRSPLWPLPDFFRAGKNFTGHWREYTLPELVYMCEASGFTVILKQNINLLARFKFWSAWRKNLRALITKLSFFLPGSREMNYVLCRLLPSASISPPQSTMSVPPFPLTTVSTSAATTNPREDADAE